MISNANTNMVIMINKQHITQPLSACADYLHGSIIVNEVEVKKKFEIPHCTPFIPLKKGNCKLTHSPYSVF